MDLSEKLREEIRIKMGTSKESRGEMSRNGAKTRTYHLDLRLVPLLLLLQAGAYTGLVVVVWRVSSIRTQIQLR